MNTNFAAEVVMEKEMTSHMPTFQPLPPLPISHFIPSLLPLLLSLLLPLLHLLLLLHLPPQPLLPLSHVLCLILIFFSRQILLLKRNVSTHLISSHLMCAAIFMQLKSFYYFSPMHLMFLLQFILARNLPEIIYLTDLKV